MRRMCPTQRSQIALIPATTSYVLPSLYASSFMVRPVMTLTILLFVPFSALFTADVRSRASDPYIIIEYTALT